MKVKSIFREFFHLLIRARIYVCSSSTDRPQSFLVNLSFVALLQLVQRLFVLLSQRVKFLLLLNTKRLHEVSLFQLLLEQLDLQPLSPDGQLTQLLLLHSVVVEFPLERGDCCRRRSKLADFKENKVDFLYPRQTPPVRQ